MNAPSLRFRADDGSEYPEWVESKLSDVCFLITKQTGYDYSATIKPSLFNERKPDTYSFIQNKDFGGLNVNLNTDFYIPIEVAKDFPKITLDTPSLLVSISGKIGNVGLYNRSEKAFIGGAVGICKLNADENGEFLLHQLESDKGQKILKGQTKASSHQNITVEDIRNLPIAYPSLPEQKKIADFLSSVDEKINLIDKELNQLKRYKKALLQQMFV